MFEGADGSLGGKGTQLVGVEGGQEGRSDGVEFLSPDQAGGEALKCDRRCLRPVPGALQPLV